MPPAGHFRRLSPALIAELRRYGTVRVIAAQAGCDHAQLLAWMAGAIVPTASLRVVAAVCRQVRVPPQRAFVPYAPEMK